MKLGECLGRNPLKGALGGYALHAVLCRAGHNLRMILGKLRLLYVQMDLTMHALLVLLAACFTRGLDGCSLKAMSCSILIRTTSIDAVLAGLFLAALSRHLA